jgi:hypothetical protein
MKAQRKSGFQTFLLLTTALNFSMQTDNDAVDDEFNFPDVRTKCGQTYEEFVQSNSEIYIGFLAGYAQAKVRYSHHHWWTTVQFRFLQKILLGAAPLAIERINQRNDLLPGLTLKFFTRDISKTLEKTRPIK